MAVLFDDPAVLFDDPATPWDGTLAVTAATLPMAEKSGVTGGYAVPAQWGRSTASVRPLPASRKEGGRKHRRKVTALAVALMMLDDHF